MQKQLKKCLTGVLLSGLLLSGCATTAVDPKTDKSYEKAKMDFAAQNYSIAFREIQGPAKAGIADAQYALGYMYFYGKGVLENRGLAQYWFEKAAAQGQADAQKALRLIQK